MQAAVYVVTGLLLVLCRRAPLWCLAGIAAVSLVEFAAVGAPEGLGVALPTTVAGYSVARYVDRRRSWWGLVLIGAVWLAWDGFDPVVTSWRLRLEQLGWISPWVVAWLVGALVRAQLLQVAQRRDSQREREARAALEERNRIARELHDVIGHSVSVMTVQASAVRRRLTPAQAVEREALESVEAVGREALVEMRRMVGVRRQDDDADWHPAPGLDQVDALVAKFRAAGLPVDLRVEGTARELPPGLDLTVYRIVREALTNALRHAVAVNAAEVVIARTQETVAITVRDDETGADRDAVAGHGLLGFAERVSLFGGTLVARPANGRGFELIASLPVPVDPTGHRVTETSGQASTLAPS